MNKIFTKENYVLMKAKGEYLLRKRVLIRQNSNGKPHRNCNK